MPPAEARAGDFKCHQVSAPQRFRWHSTLDDHYLVPDSHGDDPVAFDTMQDGFVNQSPNHSECAQSKSQSGGEAAFAKQINLKEKDAAGMDGNQNAKSDVAGQIAHPDDEENRRQAVTCDEQPSQGSTSLGEKRKTWKDKGCQQLQGRKPCGKMKSFDAETAAHRLPRVKKQPRIPPRSRWIVTCRAFF